MPYKIGYDNGSAVLSKNRVFIQKPVKTRGTLDIRAISPDIVKKYNLTPGSVTPWTRLRLVGR